VDLWGSRLKQLGAEAMLLHLLVHANQHAFTPLRLLHDIRFALTADQASLRYILSDLVQVGKLDDSVRLARDVRRPDVSRSCVHAVL